MLDLYERLIRDEAPTSKIEAKALRPKKVFPELLWTKNGVFASRK